MNKYDGGVGSPSSMLIRISMYTSSEVINVGTTEVACPDWPLPIRRDKAGLQCD